MFSNAVATRCKMPDIHYGLILLIELAEAYEYEGCPLLYVSNKHGFPMEELYPIVDRLENIGLITRDSNNPEWICLKSSPGRQWIYEIISTLKAHSFY